MTLTARSCSPSSRCWNARPPSKRSASTRRSSGGPSPQLVPADREADAFVTSLREAGVHQAGLNFFAGDMAGGDRGLVSWTGRSTEFRDNVQLTAAIGEQLGCRLFNALYGNRDEAVTPELQDELALENLSYAMDAVAAIGGTVLIEAVSGADRYALRTAADAMAVIDRANQAAGPGNCRFLADLYHLTVNGDDDEAAIAAHAPAIGATVAWTTQHYFCSSSGSRAARQAGRRATPGQASREWRTTCHV